MRGSLAWKYEGKRVSKCSKEKEKKGNKEGHGLSLRADSFRSPRGRQHFCMCVFFLSSADQEDEPGAESCFLQTKKMSQVLNCVFSAGQEDESGAELCVFCRPRR